MIDNKIRMDDSLLDCIEHITITPIELGFNSYEDTEIACLYTIRNNVISIKAFANQVNPLWFKEFSPKQVGALYIYAHNILAEKKNHNILINLN